MSQSVTIMLDKPIASARLQAEPAVQASGQAGHREQQELERENLGRVCRALQDAVNKLNQFQGEMVTGHKEQIAKLSVEIAAKILAQKIEQGDYKIESIVQEALQSAPTRQDLVVHLNPEDLDQLQKAQADNPDSTLTEVKFVADANISRAECLVETPKGTVESLIEEHLAKVSEALRKAE